MKLNQYEKSSSWNNEFYKWGVIHQLEHSQLAVGKTIRLQTSWKVPSWDTPSWLEIIKHFASWQDASQQVGRE